MGADGAERRKSDVTRDKLTCVLLTLHHMTMMMMNTWHGGRRVRVVCDHVVNWKTQSAFDCWSG